MAGPKLISATNYPFPVTVELVFDSNMLNDNGLVDPGSYVFNHGAYVTNVEILEPTKVRLFVENLFGYSSFNIQVSDVKDSSETVIDPSFNSLTFSVTRPNVPNYALAITSDNGRLKSGTSVIDVEESESYWYIMTESGVDIVNKVSLRNEGFVLDGYEEGFNSILVSGS